MTGPEIAPLPGERLNRYLARSGVSSRRSADVLIASGVVLVNGRRPPPSGCLIDPTRDRVSVSGVDVVPAAQRSYVALNKPVGFVTTADDPGERPTVMDLVKAPGRLFSIGRLDMDSHGLLILTDDGELANRLMHPRYKVPKEYLATVEGMPSEPTLRKLRRGIRLEDGVTAPAEVALLSSRQNRTQLRITITEGRNRQVRRMLEAVGHPVKDLQRTAYGPLRLGRLKQAGWRRLRPFEIDALRRAAGLG